MFVKRGLENPAKTLTQKGFREYYVKAVIQEDLPYSFGDKDGIKALFEYVLPAGFVLPSQFVVCADLDRLYNELSMKLSQKILVSDELSFNDELAHADVGPHHRLMTPRSQSHLTYGQARTQYTHLLVW